MDLQPQPVPVLRSSSSSSFSDEELGEKEKTETSVPDVIPNEKQAENERKLHRRFLLKLDFFLMSWAFCAYLMKMIDTSNYKTAYVSGMKEDLNFMGNELNWLDSWFRIGYAIFLIPSQLILSSVPANWWLPFAEIMWGILTGSIL